MLRWSHRCPLILFGLLMYISTAQADTLFDRVYTYFFPATCQVTLYNDDARGRTFYIAPGTVVQNFSNKLDLKKVAKVLPPGKRARLWEKEYAATRTFTIYAHNQKFNSNDPRSKPFVPRNHVNLVGCDEQISAAITDIQQKKLSAVDVQHLYSLETRRAMNEIFRRLARNTKVRRRVR